MPTTRLQYDFSVRIDRPIDEVFAYLADPANGLRHDPSIVSGYCRSGVGGTLTSL
jgi:hypothetical protein